MFIKKNSRYILVTSIIFTPLFTFFALAAPQFFIILAAVLTAFALLDWADHGKR